MKRFIAFLLLFFFTSTNSCFAYSYLYYLKGITTENANPIIEKALAAQNYHIESANPYYAKSGNDSIVIITQKSGNNMFYFYQSEKEKVNKSFLKEIKNLGIIYEQSFNANLIDIYNNLANDLISRNGAEKTYTFEEPKAISSQKSEVSPSSYAFEPPQKKENVYQGYVTQLNAGTKIGAYLQNAINTANSAQGDKVVAVVTNNIIQNGTTIIPQGSLIYGELSKARPATYGSRNGRVVISFNQIVTPDNNVYNITAEEIDFTVSNEGKVGESIKGAASAAIVGALVGLIFAALSGSDHILRSTAIGAGVGAGASAISSTAERGVDAEIPSFTEIEITLTSPINVSIGY